MLQFKLSTVKFLFISNIPNGFDAADLRYFFSELIQVGAFIVFHYKRRRHLTSPTHGGDGPKPNRNLINNDKNNDNNEGRGEGEGESCCCYCIVKREFVDIVLSYNGSSWYDKNDSFIDSKCRVQLVQVIKGNVKSTATTESQSQSQSQPDDFHCVSKTLSCMINEYTEFRPPKGK